MRILLLPFLVIAWLASIAFAYPVHPRSIADLAIRDGTEQNIPHLALRFDAGPKVESLEARSPNAKHKLRHAIQKAKHLLQQPFRAIRDRMKPHPASSTVDFDPSRMGGRPLRRPPRTTGTTEVPPRRMRPSQHPQGPRPMKAM